MSTYLQLEDFDRTFSMINHDNVLIINDLDPNLIADRQKLIEQLVTRYEGDSLSVVPSCECGETYGAYKRGYRCQHCGTAVEQSTERAIESSVWMSCPENVEGFIHPMAYNHFSRYFNNAGVNVVDWLCRLPGVKTPEHNVAIERLKSLGFERGINNFIRQFDLFLEHGFHSKICGGANMSKKDREEFKGWLIHNRALLFPKHLPFPSRITFVVEEEATQGFVDKNVSMCIDAAITMMSIQLGAKEIDPDDSRTLARAHRRSEERSYMACSQLSKFLYKFLTDNIGGKQGWYRKHVFGSRLTFTFRAVITSISVPHCYTDLHLPWSLAVNLFALHTTNYLLSMNWTPRAIKQLLMDHTNVYHPLLDELMEKIIKRHPFGKFPALFQRNPSLSRLSAQQLFITKVKKDPGDRSISLSQLILKGFNADPLYR